MELLNFKKVLILFLVLSGIVLPDSSAMISKKLAKRRATKESVSASTFRKKLNKRRTQELKKEKINRKYGKAMIFPERECFYSDKKFNDALISWNERNDLLKEFDLFEPCANLYALYNKIYNIDLIENEKEILELLNLFSDEKMLYKCIDFMYRNPNDEDDVSFEVVPIYVLLNIHEKLLSSDMPNEKHNCYVQKNRTFVKKVLNLYQKYINEKDIDLNTCNFWFFDSYEIAFQDLIDDFEIILENINNNELNRYSEFEDSLNYLIKFLIFNEKHGLKPTEYRENYFSDKISKIVDKFYKNTIFIEKLFTSINLSNDFEFKKFLIDIVVKIEEKIIDSISAKNKEDDNKILLSNLTKIFKYVFEWQEEDLKELEYFLTKQITYPKSQENLINKVVAKKTLFPRAPKNFPGNKYLYDLNNLILKYADLSKGLNEKFFKLILSYRSALKSDRYLILNVFKLVTFKDLDLIDYTNSAKSLIDSLCSIYSKDEIKRIIDKIELTKNDIINRVDQKNLKFSKLEYIDKQNNLKDIALFNKDLVIFQIKFAYMYFHYTYEYLKEDNENKRNEIKKDFEEAKKKFLVEYNKLVIYIKELQENIKD